MTHRSDIGRLFSEAGISGLQFQEIRERSQVDESRNRWPLLKSAAAAVDAPVEHRLAPTAAVAPVEHRVAPSLGGIPAGHSVTPASGGAPAGHRPSPAAAAIGQTPSVVLEPGQGLFSRLLEPATSAAPRVERRGANRPWSERAATAGSLQDVFARLLETDTPARSSGSSPSLRRLVR